MLHPEINSYSSLLAEFKPLKYADKLHFFHLHFGIIPFSFPAFDTDISWYSDEDKFTLLIENFYKEKPKKFTCEKIFTEDDCTIKFSVQPVSSSQRIQYNRFIIAAFFQLFNSFKKKFDIELQAANDRIEFLTTHIQRLIAVQHWIKYSINKLQVKTTLRIQFLQVLFSGLNFYSTCKEATIQKRRKFVELYLFSQGLLFADHLSTLQRLLNSQRTYHTSVLFKPTSQLVHPANSIR